MKLIPLYPALNPVLMLTLSLLGLLSLPAHCETFTVRQKNKAFSHNTLVVKKGDVVHFKNEDPFFHNIFSLSDAALFDLGSYPRGESRSVTFDQPGTIEIECAIHSSVFMTIEVKE